jgi:hypothetical protein
VWDQERDYGEESMFIPALDDLWRNCLRENPLTAAATAVTKMPGLKQTNFIPRGIHEQGTRSHFGAVVSAATGNATDAGPAIELALLRPGRIAKAILRESGRVSNNFL